MGPMRLNSFANNSDLMNRRPEKKGKRKGVGSRRKERGSGLVGIEGFNGGVVAVLVENDGATDDPVKDSVAANDLSTKIS